MANPNIVSVASIYGNTVYDTDIATSAASLVSNAASSGKILKINSLIIANIDGTNSADITVTLRNAAGGSLYSTLANTVAVPADATLIVLSKDTSKDLPPVHFRGQNPHARPLMEQEYIHYHCEPEAPARDRSREQSAKYCRFFQGVTC